MNTLEKHMNNLSTKPLTKGEAELAAQRFSGFMNCLIEMWQDLKENEGCYFDKGIIKGARGRTQPLCPKYTPYRIFEKEKP